MECVRSGGVESSWVSDKVEVASIGILCFLSCQQWVSWCEHMVHSMNLLEFRLCAKILRIYNVSSLVLHLLHIVHNLRTYRAPILDSNRFTFC